MSFYLLQIHCGNCNSFFSYTLDDIEEKEIECQNCNKNILSFKKYSGYIYILSNESLNNTLKIGCTERPIQERINELSKSTSIPTPFILEACFYSENHYLDEANIHKELLDFRINNGREFFKIGISEATELVSKLIGRKPYFVGEQLTNLYKKKELDEAEKQKEKTNRNPSNKIGRDEKYYCPKCGKYITPPDTTILSKYALFWRDKSCPVCETKLIKK